MREKRVIEKQNQELREENAEFYTLEEKIKRYIEENERLKGEVRQGQREHVVLMDKAKKQQGESDNLEREVKRLKGEVTESLYAIESGER